MVPFQLRPFVAEDAPSIYEHANDAEVAQNLRDVFPMPYTYQDAVAYIASCAGAGEERQLCRAIVADGKAVGSIGLFLQGDVYRKSAELGYWLGRPYWGQGIMSRAVMLLCQEGFERYDICRIFAEPYATNLGSRRVLEKAGFVLEGVMRKSVIKNGVILDSCLYALVK